MTFDKWFNSQSTLVKAILLLLPFVGWGWFLGVIDFVYLLLKGHLILAE